MAQLFIPLDGRITSQNVLSSPLDGTEAMEIVSPGNATQGNTYQVTTAALAAFMSAFPILNAETITTGATAGIPYNVQTTDTLILFEKVIPSASYTVLPLAATMVYPFGVTFKDISGNANTYPITILFTNGELCDGLSQLVIEDNYGWVSILPVRGGGAWYQLGY